jgi:hypothetical protein
MTEETIVYFYMRGGSELISTSLDLAITRRDPNTVIYADDGNGKRPIKLE